MVDEPFDGTYRLAGITSLLCIYVYACLCVEEKKREYESVCEREGEEREEEEEGEGEGEGDTRNSTCKTSQKSAKLLNSRTQN
mmetsp:Transcript_82916/g.134444  ORF Transcript_82916/g.134444 Transcript_82916/m.134444 type:complete len:83 (+) Transcript_82916:98-346(+)